MCLNTHFKFKDLKNTIKYSQILRFSKMIIVILATFSIGILGCKKVESRNEDVGEQKKYGILEPNLIVNLSSTSDTLIGHLKPTKAVGTKVKAKAPMKRKISSFNIKSKEPQIIPINRRNLEIVQVEAKEDRITTIGDIQPQLISQPVPIKALPMRFKDAAQFNIQ
ncbi:MAG: hypothetical protein ABJH72_05910, partial [Reichenbachiella sp.]|uniref:hypothetical protein n=1 Tax=Reichenbachiella sp. TaxID=2184521 RepID=UPI003298CD00